MAKTRVSIRIESAAKITKSNQRNLTLAHLKQSLIVFAVLLSILCLLASIHDSSSLVAAKKHKGHVHINVWRGPSKGYKKHKFAPWGYYAKLPADEMGKKHHYG